MKPVEIVTRVIVNQSQTYRLMVPLRSGIMKHLQKRYEYEQGKIHMTRLTEVVNGVSVLHRVSGLVC